jgi:hypothetical protein
MQCEALGFDHVYTYHINTDTTNNTINNNTNNIFKNRREALGEPLQRLDGGVEVHSCSYSYVMLYYPSTAPYHNITLLLQGVVGNKKP